MADIKIDNIFSHSNSGSDLFSDSESFLKDLGDEDDQIAGGYFTPLSIVYPPQTTLGNTITPVCSSSFLDRTIVFKTPVIR